MPRGINKITGIPNRWKGEDAGYYPKHQWLTFHYGRIQKCEDCGTTEKRVYDWANISGKYFRDRSDWKRLCRPCHRKLDAHLVRRGEKVNTAKLTAEQVKDLRLIHDKNPGLSQSELAKLFGVCQSTVGRILQGKYWKHIVPSKRQKNI